MNNKKIKNNSQRGQALIIAILLISVVGAIAFGVALIALSEYASGRNIEHSIEAYYSAEAGIEDGLKRFKNFPGSTFEIPEGAVLDSADPTSSKKVAKVNLEQLGEPSISQPTIVPDGTVAEPTVSEATDHIYYLKAFSKIRCIPGMADYARFCQFTLAKDQSLTLDLSGLIDSSGLQATRFLISIEKIGAAEEPGKKREVWLRWYQPLEGSDDLYPLPDLRRVSKDFFECYTGSINNAPGLQFYIGDCSSISLSPIPANPDLTPTNFQSIRTYNANFLKIKAFSNETNPGPEIMRVSLDTQYSGVIGGPKLYIESTGFYRGSKRKIVGSYDKETSNWDVMDYTLYSLTNIF